MPRHHEGNDMSLLLPGKIRKRGCSSSASSSSSIIHNYRFKRAILVGKRATGSATLVPTSRGGMESPKAKQQSPRPPVSARKLAATLWEMNNDVSSGRAKETEENDERRMRKEIRAREKERGAARSMISGSLPPHLSDPSHSPVSERMDRSGRGSIHRRNASTSHRLRLTDQYSGVFDSRGHGSLMEIETRSRTQTPARSIAQTLSVSAVGTKPRLKDVSNALTTSKELLKIIHRIWGNEDQPSSSMALISALHTELERARLLVNQHIHEQRLEQNEMAYLMKCFAEEKAVWKSKERKVVEAAIESVAGELEVERKLRRRLESLNKKLGKELAETKASLLKAVKDLESEKRTREIMEQVCDDLARNISEDRLEADELNWESAKVREENEKEREMMQFSDFWREERAQEKLSEAKYETEEKNAAVDMLRSQLEAFMGSKQTKEKGRSSAHMIDDDIAAYLGRTRLGSHQDEEQDEDGGEVEDEVECQEDSAESDLHSIEPSMGNNNNNNKSYSYSNASGAARDLRRAQHDEEEVKVRRSMSGKPPRKSTSLQRSISDRLEWGMQTERLQNSGDVDWDSFPDLEKQMQAKDCGEEMQGYKSSKGLRDQMFSGSRLGSSRVHASPTRQWVQPWPSRDPTSTVHDRPPSVHGSGSKSRLAELRGDGQIGRRSK